MVQGQANRGASAEWVVRDSRGPGQAGISGALRLAFAAAVIGMVVLSAGCRGGSGGPGASATRATAAPGTVEALPAELETILGRVAAVRGLSAPAGLKVGFVSRSELPALLQRLTTDDDRRVFAHTTTLYRLLGHLRKDQTYEAVYNEFTGQAVIGLYSPQDKALWVVHEDGKQVDLGHLSKDVESTLAHELTHAVQDAHFDLLGTGRSVEDDADRSLAYSAAVEGDAVTNERAYGAKYLALPGPRGAMLAVARTAAMDVPSSIAREMYFPYQDGTAFIEALRARKGTAAVDALLKSPPVGTAVILHPELLDAGFSAADVTLPDLAKALGDGWARESGGSLGEFGLRNYLQLRLPGLDAARAAAGWAGDHYDVYVQGGESVAIFRVRFGGGGDSTEFQAQLAKFLAAQEASGRTVDGALEVTNTKDGNTTVRIDGTGDDVLYVIGSNEAAALRAARALRGS